jgi:hypothetical protein
MIVHWRSRIVHWLSKIEYWRSRIVHWRSRIVHWPSGIVDWRSIILQRRSFSSVLVYQRLCLKKNLPVVMDLVAGFMVGMGRGVGVVAGGVMHVTPSAANTFPIWHTHFVPGSVSVLTSTQAAPAMHENLNRKVRLYKEYHTVCVPASELLDSPTPLSPASVPLPPEPNWGAGGAHSPAGEGLGESQFRRLEKSLALCLLCVT